MTDKERFIEIFKTNIKRKGADKLLDYICNLQIDFFAAHVSTDYNNNCYGELVKHSLNLYDCLVDFLRNPTVREKYGIDPSDETVAVVALLHDLCKVNFYRNDIKDATHDRGVYVITRFMRLTREEAFAIQYDIEYSGKTPDVSEIFAEFPLAYALSCADKEVSSAMKQK